MVFQHGYFIQSMDKDEVTECLVMEAKLKMCMYLPVWYVLIIMMLSHRCDLGA